MVTPIQRANDAISEFMSDPDAAALGMEGAVRDELSKLRGPGPRDRREAEEVLADAQRMIVCMPQPPAGLRRAADELQAMLSAIPRDVIDATPLRPGLLGLSAGRTAGLSNALAPGRADARAPQSGEHTVREAAAAVLRAQAATGLDAEHCGPVVSAHFTRASLGGLAHLSVADATTIARRAGATTGAAAVVDAVALSAGQTFWAAVRDEVVSSLTRSADVLGKLQTDVPLGRLCQRIADGDPSARAFARTLGADDDRLLEMAVNRDISGLRELVGAALRTAAAGVVATRDAIAGQPVHARALQEQFPFALERVASRVGLQVATLDFGRPATFVLEQGARAVLDDAKSQDRVALVSTLVTSIAVGLAGGAWAAVPLALGTGVARSGAAWEGVDIARAALVAGDADSEAVDGARANAMATTLSSAVEVGLAGAGGVAELGAGRTASLAETALERAEIESAEAVSAAAARGASSAAERSAAEALDAEVAAARNVASAQRAETQVQLVHATLDAAHDLEPLGARRRAL